MTLPIIRALRLLAPAACMSAAAPAFSQPCNVPGPDILVGLIFDVNNSTADATHDALSLGMTISNNGSTVISCAGCPANTHPVACGQLYRYSTVDGAARFEQVGMSWMKSNFVPANAGTLCPCTVPGTRSLGIGCSDTYGGGFQFSQGLLGPRYQINAYTGFFPATCPPHPVGGNFGRLEVPLADIAVTAGGPSALARYFGEQLVISPDDATYTDAAHPAPRNWLNNASNIEMTVSGGPTNYTFALLGGNSQTMRGVPAIQRWKLIDPAVTESSVIVPAPPANPNATEGLYIISSRATQLHGGGGWRYEYAVYNMNSDRCGGSFSVPVPASATLTNIAFHGVLYRGGDGEGGVNFDGTDWTPTRSGSTLTWATAPYSAATLSANALRFGTLYNFRFDTDLPPAAAAAGSVTLGLWKPPPAGGPTSITATAQVPAPAPPCRADMDGNGQIQPADVASFVNTWFASLQAGNLDADFDFSGAVEPADVANFVNVWLVAVSGVC